MRNPFKKSQMNKHEATIAAHAKRGEQLAAKRVVAQNMLDDAIKARQQALLAGDLDDDRALTKAQAAVDTATSALTGLDDAITVLSQQKAEADAQLAVARDRVERGTASEKLAAQIAAIDAALPLYLEHSRALADALSAVAHFHFESDQMAQFVQSTMSQVEIAANFALVELKAMPDAIREGRQPIPATPKAIAPIAPEPPPPTMTEFMIRSARFRDHEGKRRFAGQYDDAIMPVTTAQKAMRLGLAVSTADPRRGQLRGARGSDYRPDAPDVVDIDAAEEHSALPYVGPDSVLRDANITVIDRGPARSGQIKVERVL
jgi:hypothetical protein